MRVFWLRGPFFWLGGQGALQLQQCRLALQPAGVARQAAVTPQHPVAWHHHADRVASHGGPSRALAVTFLAPVFALLYGTVFLNEAITPWMIGCGLVIVCGTMLSTGLISTSRKPLEAAKRT